MPVRTKAPLPVGSTQWIQDENRQISQFGVQEFEDFTFSARNEIEWLNEHMADIFSKNQVNVTEIFKTPGKLRGKTPRTNRKRNPLEFRQPLTDIFSTNASLNVNPLHSKNLQGEVSKGQVAEDPRESTLPGKASQQNTDSGYHGSEDETDVRQTDTNTPQILAVEQDQKSPPPEKSPACAVEALTNSVEEQGTTEGSFHSAKEDMTSLEISKEPSEPSEPAAEENGSNDPEPEIPLHSIPGSFPPHDLTTAEAISEAPVDLGGIENESALEDNNSIDVLGSPSEGSSPVKPLIRKSSLTFAALPAREPLTTKKSIGSRVSATAHLDQPRATMTGGSFLGRYTGGKSLGGIRQPDHVNNGLEDSMDEHQAEMPHLSREESDGDTKLARLHNKSSTQRLHDNINMLGKSQPARPTKSIPAAAIITHPIYPDLPQFDAQLPTFDISPSKRAVNGHDNSDDDDWIQPPQIQAKDSTRPQLNGLPADTGTASAIKPDKQAQAVVGLERARETESRKAAVQWQDEEKVTRAYLNLNAEVEQASSSNDGQPTRLIRQSPRLKPDPEVEQAFSSHHGQPTRPTRKSPNAEVEQACSSNDEQPTRPTRQSPRLNPDAEMEHAGSSNDGQLTRPIRQSPRRVQKQQEAKKALEPLENQINNVENSLLNPTMAPPPSYPVAQSSQLQRPKDLRRPVKLAKEMAPKSKPQPVAIRVGTLSQRIPLTNTALSSSLSESLAPPPPKQAGLVKKASNISLQTSSSNNSSKSSTTSNAPKPKALLAAERKKEQDEREAQRKLEQKRENERKRAAQQEELRRQEQAHRQELERQRERERSVASEDPKKIAQRQAIEKRRLEVGKKEQQRQATQQAKSQPFPATNRPELGAVRHPSKLHTVQDYSRPLPNQPTCNPAKPAAKRVFDPEADDEPVRSVRMAGGPSYQQTDKKRRRTEDEDLQELMVRPPIRQSNIRKDAPKPSIFSSNYSGVHQSSNNYHQSSSMVKTAAPNQTYQQHQVSNQAPRPGLFNEMAKYTTGKIPFAETPNPPTKSPLHPRQPAAAPVKSSPQYINGENIELEDIPTDSDEEDSDDEKAKGAMLADWAQSPELRKILEEQEKNANADDVFGPPGSPQMEEMFKERRDRFRNRTSSANWNGSDRLTEEEIRNDRAGRERLRKQGGWYFGL